MKKMNSYKKAVEEMIKTKFSRTFGVVRESISVYDVEAAKMYDDSFSVLYSFKVKQPKTFGDEEFNGMFSIDHAGDIDVTCNSFYFAKERMIESLLSRKN